jgi:UDP-GlcNAc:undecaprenyl-phosphate GlcNAc-1-phosphate transferase
MIPIFASVDILAGLRFPLLAAAVALLTSWIATPLVRKFAISKGAIDDPSADDRRVHTEPTPRWGGLAIYGGFLLALLVVLPFAYPRPFPAYLIGMIVLGALVVVVGAIDDVRPLSAKVQLVFLLAVGVAIQFCADPAGKVQISSLFSTVPAAIIRFGPAAIPITAIYIFVVTKTTDTIDGIDGLAAGITAITATALTILAVYGGQPRVALVAAALAGAALGFLRHNFNPAKIFMGTGGAYFLGFSLACLSVVGAMKTAAAVAVLVPVLAFGVPIFDAVFVIGRRLLHHQPIMQADKRHVHHTLLGMGLSQRQAVLVLYLIAATLSVALVSVVLKHHA